MTPASVPTGVFDPELEARLGPLVAQVSAVLGPVDEVAIGWATVELDRAVADLLRAAPSSPVGGAATVPRAVDRAVTAADDTLLGARGRLLAGRAASPSIVVLEPSTEGRLAASLARYGEGPIALFLRVPRPALERLRAVAAASGISLSRPAPGPFGAAVLVLDGPPWGPHLVVTEADRRGTIDQ
jgi:hypothetical protein